MERTFSLEQTTPAEPEDHANVAFKSRHYQNTDYRCGPYQGNPNVCRRVIQTSNVTTDDRGYIYIVVFGVVPIADIEGAHAALKYETNTIFL